MPSDESNQLNDSEDCKETPLETLEALLREVTGQEDLTRIYAEC
jgi:hypothetical protein